MGFTEIRYPVEKKFPLWWEQFFQLYQFSAQQKPRESGGGAANAFLLGNVMDIKWWCTEAAYVPRWGELKRGAGGMRKYWRWYGFIQRKGEAITQHDSDILRFEVIGGSGDWADHSNARPGVSTLPRVHVARSPWARHSAVEWAESARVCVA